MHGGGGGGARMIYKNCWGESYWCSVDEEEGGAVGRDAVEDDTVEREGDAVEGVGDVVESCVLLAKWRYRGFVWE